MEKYGILREHVKGFMDEGDTEEEAMEKVASGQRPKKDEKKDKTEDENG